MLVNPECKRNWTESYLRDYYRILLGVSVSAFSELASLATEEGKTNPECGQQ